MKEFRIGQRVRVVQAKLMPRLVGTVGTIDSDLYPHIGGVMVYDFRPDGEKKSYAGPPHSFEPIDDDVGDWSVIAHVTGWSPIKENVS